MTVGLSPTNASVHTWKYVGQKGSTAMLAIKWNPLYEGEKARKRGIHPCFETMGRLHQKSSIVVSVAPRKGLSYPPFFKCRKLDMVDNSSILYFSVRSVTGAPHKCGICAKTFESVDVLKVKIETICISIYILVRHRNLFLVTIGTALFF